jgi:hypothetical protein
LLPFDQRSLSVEGKKCKLECKLERQVSNTGLSSLTLQFTRNDLDVYFALRAIGLAHKTVIWLKKAAELL